MPDTSQPLRLSLNVESANMYPRSDKFEMSKFLIASDFSSDSPLNAYRPLFNCPAIQVGVFARVPGAGCSTSSGERPPTCVKILIHSRLARTSELSQSKTASIFLAFRISSFVMSSGNFQSPSSTFIISIRRVGNWILAKSFTSNL